MENQIVTLEKLVYGGDCLAHLGDGRTVFVPLGLPGEQVEIEIAEDKNRYARGKIVRLIAPSSERVDAACPHFGVCGGCHYQHAAYAQQLSIKTDVVMDQLRRIGKLENIPFSGITPSPQPFFYRNQVQFHPDADGRLCFQTMGGRTLIPIQTCLLPVEGINSLWTQLSLEPDSGILRVNLREDSLTNDFIVFEGEEETSPEFDVDLSISATYLNPEGRAFTLAGDDLLVYEVLGKELRVSPESFFQVNLAVASEMVKHILVHLPKNQSKHILELYSGVGLFSIFLAEHTDQLTAMEASPSACYDFAENLDAFENVSLYEGSVESNLPGLIHDLGEVDLVLLDPPRAGLHPRALDALVKLSPGQIIYISCDPSTLSRDLAKLTNFGYQILDLHLFDMFPQTYHVETVVLISRANP